MPISIETSKPIETLQRTDGQLVRTFEPVGLSQYLKTMLPFKYQGASIVQFLKTDGEKLEPNVKHAVFAQLSANASDGTAPYGEVLFDAQLIINDFTERVNDVNDQQALASILNFMQNFMGQDEAGFVDGNDHGECGLSSQQCYWLVLGSLL